METHMKFLKFINGNYLRSDVITAVMVPESGRPRVIIEYGLAKKQESVEINFSTRLLAIDAADEIVRTINKANEA